MKTPSKHTEANQFTIKNYIKFLYDKELSFIEELDFELLKFFCSYLVTTPESKYTFSYYNGKVELFKPFLVNFKKKLDNYVAIYNHLYNFSIDNNILNNDLYLVFDESIIFYFNKTKFYALTDNSNISKISTNGLTLIIFKGDDHTKSNNFAIKIHQKEIDSNSFLKHIEDDFLFFIES
jgi:hypothetical protein